MKFVLRNGDTQPGANVKISASVETGLAIADKIAGLVNATKMHAVEEFRLGVERASRSLFVMAPAFEITHIRQASFVFSCTQTSIPFLPCVCVCARVLVLFLLLRTLFPSGQSMTNLSKLTKLNAPYRRGSGQTCPIFSTSPSKAIAISRQAQT